MTELPRQRNPKTERRGFTLVELAVVMMLVGLTAGLALPRLRPALLSDPLRASVRQLTGIITELRDRAVEEQRDQVLVLEPGTGRCWAETSIQGDPERAPAPAGAWRVPSEVRILEAEGTRTAPGTRIRVAFTRRGYTRPVTLRLASEDGRVFHLILSPFLNRLQAFEQPGGSAGS